MELRMDGRAITVSGGRARLEAEYAPADSSRGIVTLRLEDEHAHDIQEAKLRLDPWSPDAYEVHDWRAGKAIVICGAQAIMALSVGTLTVACSVGLEYQEGETVDRPWFLESDDGRRLVISTERRAWCLDDRVAIRWMWSAASAEDRWICTAPRAAEGHLLVPVRTLNRERIVAIGWDDGLETV